ncbi:MAG: glycosyltransferase family 4 protein [Isosphaeraceae bacterium]
MSSRSDRPLRVGYLVSYFHPFASGAERQALAQGIELVKRGHVVHVITHAVPGYPIEDEEYQGLFIHRWIRSSRRGPLFAWSFVRSVSRGLRQFRGELDVIHTHQGLWEAVATGIARPWRSGVATLIQPASSGYYGEADQLRRTRGFPLLRRIILRNPAFAAISEEIARQWLELGVPPNRLVRIASGVDTDHFHPGPSLIETELLPRPRVIFTGRLHPQKNLPLLLEAWQQVARQTSANLILVGPGSEREALTALSNDLGIAQRVQFAGAVPDPAEHLRAADVFVLPSVAEGMSNSLLEAMATALPCVVSGIGGNTDLVTDQETGRLVSGTSADAWAAALVELLQNPETGRLLGIAARQRIDKHFSLRVVVDRYVDLYRQMTAGAWPA